MCKFKSFLPSSNRLHGPASAKAQGGHWCPETKTPKEPSCREAVAASLDFRNNIFKYHPLLHLPTRLVKTRVFSLDMDRVLLQNSHHHQTPPPPPLACPC